MVELLDLDPMDTTGKEKRTHPLYTFSWINMNFLRNIISRSHSGLINTITRINPKSPPLSELCSQMSNLFVQERQMASLYQMHRTGPHRKVRPPRRALDGKPYMKGVVLKTLIKKPKKPNSANRKCVLVRLSNE
ncbi:hypothetical protein Trydic_g20868 [Trypoxylus dichotomus]